MCDPTGGIATAAIMLAGAGVQAYGQYQQADAANKAAEYNAQIMEQNARIAESQAQEVEAIGRKDEARLRMDNRRLRGTQRAAAAGTGALVDSGSNEDIALDTSKWGEVDAMTLRHNVQKEAWAVRAQKADMVNQARLSRMQRVNPYLGAAGTLLSGAGSALKSFR